MRKYLLTILAVALLLNLQFVNAQTVDLQFTVTNASSATSCDGEMDIQCVGCIDPVNYIWYDTSGNIIGTGNHVSGLCVCYNYWYSVHIDDYTCKGHSMFSTMKDSTTSGTTLQMKTSLHYTDDSTSNFMKIQYVTGGVGTYNYTLQNDSMNVVFENYNLTAISNIVFDSLSAPSDFGNGYYTFSVNDTSQNLMGYHFTTQLDTNSCNQGPDALWASAQGYPTSDSTTCDGWAFANAYGGTPPYTYQFASGATDSTETALCQGSYILTITDAASTVFSTTFIIGAPGTFYFSAPGSYNYIDTLYANASQNCGLDYSMPIDSFYIDSAYAVSNWAYIVNWVIVQDTNVFDFTETYFIDSTGDYLFGLSVYCDARSSTFGSYSFFAGLHADTNPGITNIEDIKENNKISVYPNPSNGIYHLTSSSKMKEYMIFDQLGRKIISKKVNSADEMINITGYGSGMYYLILQYQDGTSGKQKLFKK